MPGSLDSCISSVYEPGNIPASAGEPPTRVLIRDPFEVSVLEAAAALDLTDPPEKLLAMMSETAAAIDTAVIVGPALDAMLPGVFVNSNGMPRQANANGVMVNL